MRPNFVKEDLFLRPHFVKEDPHLRQILDKEDRSLRPIFDKVPCGLEGRAKFRHGPDAQNKYAGDFKKTLECIESEMTSARFQNKSAPS